MKKRFRKQVPHCSGWWLWKEGRHTTQLLIAGNERHTEVSTDDALVQVLKREIKDSENFYEMTDTKTMGGLWMLLQAFEFAD